MKNVMPAFNFLEEGDKIPIGYQKINLHMIFDVKMDFYKKGPTRKEVDVASATLTTVT